MRGAVIRPSGVGPWPSRVGARRSRAGPAGHQRVAGDRIRAGRAAFSGDAGRGARDGRPAMRGAQAVGRRPNGSGQDWGRFLGRRNASSARGAFTPRKEVAQLGAILGREFGYEFVIRSRNPDRIGRWLPPPGSCALAGHQRGRRSSGLLLLVTPDVEPGDAGSVVWFILRNRQPTDRADVTSRGVRASHQGAAWARFRPGSCDQGFMSGASAHSARFQRGDDRRTVSATARLSPPDR